MEVMRVGGASVGVCGGGARVEVIHHLCSNNLRQYFLSAHTYATCIYTSLHACTH